MGYERLTEKPSAVYHYTKRENLPSIHKDGRIKRMGDTECWFCLSLKDTLSVMKDTVMMEGKPYYKVGGQLARYPKFIPQDYIILKLTPRWQSGEWVRWMQELPSGADPQLREAAESFSMKKVGFRGDMKFYPNPAVLECSQLLQLPRHEMIRGQEQTM